MAFTTDLWGLVLDLKKRFDSLDTHRQFITLAIGSLICSFLYGYLLDGWVREDLRESPVTVAQVMKINNFHSNTKKINKKVREFICINRSLHSCIIISSRTWTKTELIIHKQ